jgi:hypothetical protein
MAPQNPTDTHTSGPSRDPVSGPKARIRRLWRVRGVRMGIIVLLALIAGGIGGRVFFPTEPPDPSNGRVKLKPGPWGNIEFLPITIAPPRKLLRVQGIEEHGVRWYFTGATKAAFSGLLDELNVSNDLKKSLTAPAVLSEHPQGVRLEPTCEMVRALGEKPLRRFYEILANEQENNPDRWEFLTAFTKSVVKYGGSRAAVSVLEDVSIEYGRFTVTYAMSCVLAGIDDPEEKVGLIKALSQQNSMLVRIRVTPETNVEELAAYWGRGMWTTDVEAIIESVKQRPDGGVINIMEVLPPLPGSLLHSYPTPHNFMTGPEVIKNCSWTAFNFFRDTPRPEFADENVVLTTLAEDYLPVLSDPRYGDIAVFLTPERTMRHVAVYLADNLYFTKNGNNPWHPWVYSTEEDLMESFSFGLAEGQDLSIYYFRSKAY